MWCGALKYNAIDFLKKEDADIINMQEVDGGIEEAFYFGLNERLHKELKYKYSFYMPKIWQKLGSKTVSYGQLILSKYPIKMRKIKNINGKPKKSQFMNSKDLDSINVLQHAQIEINDNIINVLNYHGYWIYGTKMGNKITENHSRKILSYLRSLDQNEKIIFSGDFNLAPNSKSLRIIGKYYSNLILKYKIKTTRNELSYPKEPIDNIFVNKKVKVKSLKVPKMYVSDHLPMIMTFE